MHIWHWVDNSSLREDADVNLCSLSKSVTSVKMATTSFFLYGKCSKRGWLGCDGSRVIFLALFLTLDLYSSWRVGRGTPIIRSAVRTVFCSLLNPDFVAEPNQTVIEVHKTGSMMAENCFSSSCGRLNLLSWRRKYNLCWAFFCNGVDVSVPIQVQSDDRSQELECLHCSHCAFMMVSRWRAGGFLLKSTIIYTRDGRYDQNLISRYDTFYITITIYIKMCCAMCNHSVLWLAWMNIGQLPL